MNCNCAICKNHRPFNMPKEIVESCEEEKLVLFCGAGISTENKTVLPFSFYTDILNELNIEDTSLSFSTVMQKYCDYPNGRRKLIQKIKERLNYIHSFPELERNATRFHKELATIFPIKTIITTNWDTYFEDYCDAIPITTPEDFSLYDSNKRHVLKIHGSIDNLSSIVATTDDYNKCYTMLTNGVLGAALKTILATKTVVFIGFSFGDEDFNQIMRYINHEMGEYSPHFYLVTLDDTLKEKIKYSNCTNIVTDGTFFLHQLRLKLINRDIIKDYTNTTEIIEIMMENLLSLHGEISSINMQDYPCVIFTLAYQDGVLHAFERFLYGNRNGEYNNPKFIASSIAGYEEIRRTKGSEKNYFDKAYYEGYQNGLIFIDCFEKKPEILKELPLLYLPGKRAPKKIKTYHQYLRQLSTDKNRYTEYAKEIIKHAKGGADEIKDIVIHHPPYSY